MTESGNNRKWGVDVLQERLERNRSGRETGGKQLFEQLRKPARQLIRAILSDHRKRAKQPHRGIIEFDSSFLPLPEGVRPAAVDVRRLIYRLDGCRVDISLYPLSTEGWELIGQVVEAERDLGDISVTVHHGRSQAAYTANQFYLFRVPRLEAGKNTLVVKTSHKTLGTIEIDV